MSDWDECLGAELHQLHRRGLLRSLRPVSDAAYPALTREGKRLINFSSNNYLGLAGHPRIIEAEEASAKRGAGSAASRLIIGHDEETGRLEREIAEWKGTESALLFSNGYMANLGVLSALLTPGDAVFSDQLNHASIIDGIRLSGAKKYIYRHNDPDHLEMLLKQADREGVKRKLIVTDTVFSMDGDLAPLKELAELKRRYGAALMVDEAHGGGVYGPEGEGVTHMLEVHDRVDLQMGTFSKAFGVYGAYVAGNRKWIRYLLNTSRSLIYTTGLPPAVIGGIRAALSLVREGSQLRQQLFQKSSRFREKLREAGFSIPSHSSPILPLVIGGAPETLRLSEALAEQGIHALAIRPPTVPPGTARIRFSFMANHDPADLDRCADTVIRLGESMGLVEQVG
ncbi:8-amino-7-oxononanoate synthase [Melghirimyces profundicolus]|uniref:8-amino-7-ketopelargonate synthase n=1 Tax=Melghirimyces profundicolus TaxID=1242148 RepID=A0A2T6AY27_9BACL|nr:8-amino-7-oxononanoate synthase [Melghirimyces profundicolus]PTX48710.1 8-amino-7-oxononanoate synthase [Melghirimyces profundicolus]